MPMRSWRTSFCLVQLLTSTTTMPWGVSPCQVELRVDWRRIPRRPPSRADKFGESVLQLVMGPPPTAGGVRIPRRPVVLLVGFMVSSRGWNGTPSGPVSGRGGGRSTRRRWKRRPATRWPMCQPALPNLSATRSLPPAAGRHDRPARPGLDDDARGRVRHPGASALGVHLPQWRRFLRPWARRSGTRGPPARVIRARRLRLCSPRSRPPQKFFDWLASRQIGGS